MKRTRRLAFLQLPHWDNDVRGPRENLRVAAGYLSWALERSRESSHWDPVICDETTDELDDGHLVKHLVNLKPEVIAATLYLWNIERTLHVLGRVKTFLPHLVVIAGGPEVARSHPFLLRSRVPDIVVEGEGEVVFPEILRCLREKTVPDLLTVGWRVPNGSFRWGSREPSLVMLPEAMPPPAHSIWYPDSRGMAYFEATRGCPLQCFFCRYPHDRRAMSFLPVEEVIERVRILRERGTREIRFVDPTLNAHPRFTELLETLASFNHDAGVEFFAELRAETLTEEQARLLARANIREVEVGVQSLNPVVLKAVGRSSDFAALERGLTLLDRHVERITLDIMYGLPHQTAADIRCSVEWATRWKHVRIQFLPTLLIPGTPLRTLRHRLGLRGQNRPPYRVTATGSMDAHQLYEVELWAREFCHSDFDIVTRRFVGAALPDLFEEKVEPDPRAFTERWPLPGRSIRRAVLLRSRDFFAERFRIAETVVRAIRYEPFVLWQFVLCVEREEPLDVLDLLIEKVRAAPLHPLDRFVWAEQTGRLAARRIMILLNRRKRYDPHWMRAAETLLRQTFL
ncbi:MAG: radical SAM protein [Kiritimatiellae bacterium]|nr:radical SAM protein [Kiritimatiellia bacterium]